ncbi:unnamed protein product [Withania somnifera]
MQGEKSNEIYRECLRNHAASLGSYATDGCGEFTLDDNDTSPGGSISLNCAACGCHRNFHRKITCGASYSNNKNNNTSRDDREIIAMDHYSLSGKKRFRTKFTTDQKEKMLAFAEKLGWTLQRKDEENETERFCKEVGVSRKVFKVWMHNHKNNSSSSSVSNTITANNASSLTQ